MSDAAKKLDPEDEHEPHVADEADAPDPSADWDAMVSVASRTRQVDPPPPEPIDYRAGLPAKGSYDCNGQCGTKLSMPGICEDCARTEVAKANAARVRAWIRTLPDIHQDVSWETMPGLKRFDGRPSVALSSYSPEKWEALRKAVESKSVVVLHGVPGGGKSTVAVAYLRACIERDPTARARFVKARDLLRTEVPEGGPAPIDLALSAEYLALDDLGDELAVELGSYELPKFAAPARRVMHERWDRKLPILITTNLTEEQIGPRYTERTSRRMFEKEATVQLRLGPKPSEAKSR